jgi:hypothetical protein
MHGGQRRYLDLAIELRLAPGVVYRQPLRQTQDLIRSITMLLGTERPHLSGPILKLVHDWPLVHRNDGFRRWWALAQCTVWSLGVVVVPPSFNDNLCFA